MSATMTIGELARQATVNPHTLRYYGRIGLLAPSARTDAGYRAYAEWDTTRLAFIWRAQAPELMLTEITDVIISETAYRSALTILVLASFLSAWSGRRGGLPRRA